MDDLQAVTDFISRGADLYRHHAPAELSAYPNLVAGAALFVGAVLAFWGARLLRPIYVMAFIAVGARMGLEAGRLLQIDPLIGLTFGGGIAGFIGYFLYRWWVASTAAVLAVVLVLGVAWPRIMDMEREAADQSTGVGTDHYILGSGIPADSPAKHWAGVVSYVRTNRRDFGFRLVAAAGLAWILGLVTGLLLPRFTVIVGTSVFGVLLLSGGIGVLLWRNAPDLWSRVASHPDWYLAGMALLLLVSGWRQSRLGKVKLPVPPPATPPPAPAAK